MVIYQVKCVLIIILGSCIFFFLLHNSYKYTHKFYLRRVSGMIFTKKAITPLLNDIGYWLITYRSLSSLSVVSRSPQSDIQLSRNRVQWPIAMTGAGIQPATSSRSALTMPLRHRFLTESTWRSQYINPRWWGGGTVKYLWKAIFHYFGTHGI